LSRKSRSTHNFDEIYFESRHEADDVLGRLYDLLSQYDQATVGDFYELSGITESFTDQKWGWTDLQGSRVTRSRGGAYLVELPRPEPLD